ncbi:MAG: hypothetical protein IPP86_06715 [Bacteroidetes bacterium]|nr:hypothetical protein [Bacteroidota bacterium]
MQLTSHPLTIGNSWCYYSEMHLVNSLGNSIQDDYYDMIWEVVSGYNYPWIGLFEGFPGG